MAGAPVAAVGNTAVRTATTSLPSLFASHSRQRKRRSRSLISVGGGSRNPCRNELGGISSSLLQARHDTRTKSPGPEVCDPSGVERDHRLSCSSVLGHNAARSLGGQNLSEEVSPSLVDRPVDYVD